MSTKYAIINVFGRQFKVKEGDKIQANYYASDVGAKVSFSDVYMLNTGSNLKVGAHRQPYTVLTIDKIEG